MPQVVADLSGLPEGAHGLGLYVGVDEAREQAVQFLSGAPEGQPTSFWVADPSLAAYYDERLAEVAPGQVGCVHVLDYEQVTPVEGRLRPAKEVAEFVGSHPGGVSGGADTISRYWSASDVSEHLEYEEWFQRQARARSRFLCPYDLTRIPPQRAAQVLRDLGRHHTHVTLSASGAPAARLLQLFVFPTADEVPVELQGTRAWAESSGLIRVDPSSREFVLTEAGDRAVLEWSEHAELR